MIDQIGNNIHFMSENGTNVYLSKTHSLAIAKDWYKFCCIVIDMNLTNYLMIRHMTHML